MATPMDVGKIEEFVFGSNQSCANEIADEISGGRTKLLQLVEASEPFLTNTSTDIRARGVRLISDVLHLLPRDTLSADEVRVLTAFFCDRLKDHHSITPHTLYGILALSNAAHIPDGTVYQVLTTIFKEVQVQTLLHVDRRSVFNIIGNFMQNQMTEIKDRLGSEFVYGFMQVMDGEKDPRNLVILFRLYPVIVKNFPINIFVEELFEVASCYFPVDFQPRSKDPDAITREMLAEGVLNCLAASPKFAQFCLPLLMEKLTSDLETAKLDSFKALALCAPIYGPSELSGYLVQIWNIIRLEIFQVFNTNTEHAVLSALRSIVQTFALSPLSGKTTDALQEFYKKVFEGCSNHLRDPELRLLQPCSHILEAIASAAPSSCSTVLEFVIPLILDQSKKDVTVTQRALILEVLHSFLMICSTTLPEATSEPTLSKSKQGILETFMSHIEDSNTRLRAASVRGLSSMMVTKGLVEEANMSVIADLVAVRLLDDMEGDVRNECALCLERMAEISPKMVQNRVLPSLWQRLTPETNSKNETKCLNTGQHPSWEKVPQLAKSEELGEVICQHLLKQLGILSSSNNSGDVEYGIQVARTLVTTSQKMTTFPNGLEFVSQSVLNQLLQWSISAALENAETDMATVFRSEEMLVVCAEAFRHAVAEMDEGKASEFSVSIVGLFLGNNNSDKFQFLTQVILGESTFKPLQIPSPISVTRLVILLQAVACSVRCQVQLPSHDALLPLLLELSLASTDWFTSTAASKCLAGILNKYEGQDYTTFIEGSKKRISEQLKQVTDEQAYMRALNLWIWISKALLMRGHPLSTGFLNSLLDSMNQPQLSAGAAEGIRTILVESPDVLNKKYHAIVRLMYKQRVFQQCLPRIRQGITNADSAVRPHYLQALSHLLSHIPHQVLMGSLEPLLPLLIQSLDQEDPLMYLSTLETLHELILDASDLVAQQVSSMLPAFLKLSQYKPKMNVRISALKCINSLTKLPDHYVLPYKSDVIRQLTAALDDKKRLVRKEAVDARCSWFLLGKV